MAQAVDSTISFCTLDEARAQLRLREEEVAEVGKLHEVINAVARSMETYCARKLKKRASTETIDLDNASRVLFLSDFPVATSPLPIFWCDDTGYGEFGTAQQLTVWPGTGSQSNYQVVVNGGTGEARRVDTKWPKGFPAVKVTATVGYDSAEAQDLKQAQMLWIAQLWGLVGRDPAMASRSVLGMSMSFELGAGDDAYGIPPSIRALLDPFRVPALLT